VLENVEVIVADTDTVNVVAVVMSTSEVFVAFDAPTSVIVVTSTSMKVIVCDP